MFVSELQATVPEAADLVAEHLADNDDLILHLLMSDLRRITVGTFGEAHYEVTDRLLGFADRCLREGHGDVANAVSVSFVEHFGTCSGESDLLLDRWPPPLRRELGR